MWPGTITITGNWIIYSLSQNWEILKSEIFKVPEFNAYRIFSSTQAKTEKFEGGIHRIFKNQEMI